MAKKRRGDFFIKPVGVARSQPAFVPVRIAFQQAGIAVNMFFKVGGIENVPILYIGDNQVFDFPIAPLLPLVEVIA